MNEKPADDMNGDLDRDFDRLEKLLARGIAEISGIEIDEIVKGMSVDDLEQKTGRDGLQNILRSEYSPARKAGGFVFEEQIRFVVEDDGFDITTADVEKYQQIADVTPETSIAVYPIDEKRPAVFERKLLEYGEDYQVAAGVKVKTDGSRLIFYAARQGKVVLLKEKIYVISSVRDSSCRVRVSADHLEARIDCSPAFGNGAKLTFSMVLAELERSDVVRGIDIKTIEAAVEEVNRSHCSKNDFVVARGQPVRHGSDSIITFHFPTEAPEIGFTILPDGRIDYRKQAPIKMVNNGDLVATVADADPGTDGYRVDGSLLPAKPGSADVVVEGDNVRKEGNNRYYAECSGVVSFHEKILCVYPYYQVDGDVDMRSGNVSFNGSVTVRGNVKSGFVVKATGDIAILGSVEAATIDAGRDVRINGAAVGGNGTVIKAGRNVFVGHVQNAQIEAQGDVEIVRSAMHSTIFSTGKVVQHDVDGSIVGGVVNAMQGIEAMSIGSAMGTQTEVVAGSDYLVKRKKGELLEIIRFYEANLAKIDMVLRPLTDIIKKGLPLGSDKKQRLGTIFDKRKEIVKQLRVLRQRYKGLTEFAPTAGSAYIVVRKTMFQDVTLKIGDQILRTGEDLLGVECRLSADLAKIEQHSFRGVAKKNTTASRSAGKG